MKASVYETLAKQVPPGPRQDAALRTFISFLEHSYSLVENRNEWFAEFQFALPRISRASTPKDANRVLSEMVRSTNPVVSLYAQAEQLVPR
jgi:hypothetical protein